MLDPKPFYRDMEQLLAAAPPRRSDRRYCDWLARRLHETFGSALGVEGIHVHAWQGGRLSRVHSEGACTADLSQEIARRRAAADERHIDDGPWAGATDHGPCAIMPAPRGDLLLVFCFAWAPPPAPSERDRLAIVSLFHWTITQHERQRQFEDMLEQARAIQMSLLPAGAPEFDGYDIAAASVPAQVVGGDFFDLHLLGPDTLAIAVSDASGHGLPAALQARDVATGLRMGVERDLRLTRTIEKLNRVIHRSGLVTRFVSLVLGELEENGNLTYVNAGHPPPLLLDDAGMHELHVGGTLLGPYPDAAFKMGFAHVDRGAALVLYSDGVIESGTAAGGAFGVERLRAWLEESRERPACDAVADLLARLRRHGAGDAFEDDVTVVLVRRLRDGAGPPPRQAVAAITASSGAAQI